MYLYLMSMFISISAWTGIYVWMILLLWRILTDSDCRIFPSCSHVSSWTREKLVTVSRFLLLWWETRVIWKKAEALSHCSSCPLPKGKNLGTEERSTEHTVHLIHWCYIWQNRKTWRSWNFIKSSGFLLITLLFYAEAHPHLYEN